MAAILFYHYIFILFNLHVLTAYYTTIYTLDFTGHIGVFKEVSFHVVLRPLREYFMTFGVQLYYCPLHGFWCSFIGYMMLIYLWIK